MSKVRCVGCGFKMYLLCCSDFRRDQQALCQQCYMRQSHTQATCDQCNQSLAPQLVTPHPQSMQKSPSRGSSMFYSAPQQFFYQQKQWPTSNQQQSSIMQQPQQPLIGQSFGGNQGYFGGQNHQGEDEYNEEEVRQALTRVYEAPLSTQGALKKERRKNGLPTTTPIYEDSDSIYSWSTLKG